MWLNCFRNSNIFTSGTRKKSIKNRKNRKTSRNKGKLKGG